MKRLFFELLLLMACPFMLVANGSLSTHSNGGFFAPGDIENIKSSAQTLWGRNIVEGLKKTVDERAKYGFEIPLGRSNRGQNYLCPKHKTILKYKVDSPHQHYCAECKKNYTGEYLDGCWRNYYQREMHDIIRDCGYIYLATGEKSYLNYLKEIFLNYAEVYPKYYDYTKEEVKKDYYLGKMFEQFLEEAIWFSRISPIYTAIANEFTSEEREKIENQLFRKAADMILTREGNHNWRSWNNSMRASLAVVLNDKNLMQETIYGPKGYFNDLKVMVFNDGWSKEGSPGYHYFSLEALTYTAVAAQAMGFDVINDKLKNMYVNVLKVTYPDFTFPALNDGGYHQYPCEYAFQYELFGAYSKDPEIYTLLEKFYSLTERTSCYALLSNKEVKPNSKPLKYKSMLLEDTGLAVLRKGEATVVFKYGYTEGGHGHPDRLSVTLHNGEKELLIDCGTFSYGQPVYNNWQRLGLSHNIVIVDGKDMKLPNPKSKTAAKLLNFKVDKKAAHASAVLKNDIVCPGVELKREIQLTKNRFNDTFTATSTDQKEHTYDYIFSLADMPEFEEDFKPTTNFKGESPAYSFVKDVKSRIYEEGAVTFKAGDAIFEIINKLGQPIEVFWTKSPDICSGSYTGELSFWNTYMLVVRTHNTDMNIESSIGF